MIKPTTQQIDRTAKAIRKVGLDAYVKSGEHEIALTKWTDLSRANIAGWRAIARWHLEQMEKK